MSNSLCVEPNMHNEYGFTEEAGHSVDRVEGFDFEAIDTLEDKIREALREGKSVTHLVSQLIELEVSEQLTVSIAKVICLIADAHKPKLVADHIAWISGMRLRQGESLPSIAKRHGVSKQAFCQAALRMAKELNLKPARAMRSEIAKATMRIRHYKRTKHE